MHSQGCGQNHDTFAMLYFHTLNQKRQFLGLMLHVYYKHFGLFEISARCVLLILNDLITKTYRIMQSQGCSLCHDTFAMLYFRIINQKRHFLGLMLHVYYKHFGLFEKSARYVLLILNDLITKTYRIMQSQGCSLCHDTFAMLYFRIINQKRHFLGFMLYYKH